MNQTFFSGCIEWAVAARICEWTTSADGGSSRRGAGWSWASSGLRFAEANQARPAPIPAEIPVMICDWAEPRWVIARLWVGAFSQPASNITAIPCFPHCPSRPFSRRSSSSGLMICVISSYSRRYSWTVQQALLSCNQHPGSSQTLWPGAYHFGHVVSEGLRKGASTSGWQRGSYMIS